MATTLLASITACDLNRTGNVGATKVGDLTHVVERGSPTEELVAACGEGARAGGDGAIRRAPYLQQVTTSSAIVGWTTMTPEDPQRVEIATPDGERVATASAAAEATIVRDPGEQQMWATITGLAPDTIYCYAIAGGDEPLVHPAGFRTAPEAMSTRPVRFLVFGDSGFGGEDQRALRNQMETVPYELILHTGDLAYESGTIDQLEELVFDVYGPLLRHLPFYPVAGNHDLETKDGQPFRDVFALPNNERWFSFDWGRVHFAAIDTEQDLAVQAAWLEADLAASQLPWKIVYLHRPPYSSGRVGSDRNVRRVLAPIFEKHGVQLVLGGHDHHYERVKPQRGVTYLVTGGGGRGTRATGASSFTAFSEEVIHLVHVEIGVDALTLHAIDAKGQQFDSARIPRVAN